MSIFLIFYFVEVDILTIQELLMNDKNFLLE